jgi:hypothetical protein
LAAVGEEAIGTVAVSPSVASVGELAPAPVGVASSAGIGVEGVAGALSQAAATIRNVTNSERSLNFLCMDWLRGIVTKVPFYGYQRQERMEAQKDVRTQGHYSSKIK